MKVSEKVPTQKRCHLIMEEIPRIPKLELVFFWYRMYDDVADFIRSCELCQKQGDIKVCTKIELHIGVRTPDGIWFFKSVLCSGHCLHR